MDLHFWKIVWMFTLFFGFIAYIVMFLWVVLNGFNDIKKILSNKLNER